MKYIGIFDSGIGGLTVAKKIIEIMPNENIIYFGDTKNCPYGTKNKDEIIKLSLEDAEFVNSYDLKCMIIACNTIDSVARTEIMNRYNLPIYGVVSPASKIATTITKNNKIGVIATTATVSSNAYVNEINSINKDVDVYQVACPKLVPLVEEGKFTKDDSETIDALHEYLESLKNKNIDSLILGCTHYPLLIDLIHEIIPNVNIISSSDAVANLVADELKRNNLLEKNDTPIHEFYVSENPQQVKQKANIFMPNQIKEIKLK